MRNSVSGTISSCICEAHFRRFHAVWKIAISRVDEANHFVIGVLEEAIESLLRDKALGQNSFTLEIIHEAIWHHPCAVCS